MKIRVLGLLLALSSLPLAAQQNIPRTSNPESRMPILIPSPARSAPPTASQALLIPSNPTARFSSGWIS